MRETRASDHGPPQQRSRPGTSTDYELRVCTWNVRTLYTPGAAPKLESVLTRYKADITAIQEIRWIGSGMQKRKDCDIYYSCHKRLHMLGCGFVVGNRLRSMIIDFKPISDRLAVIRIKATFQNISIICAHAPTDEAEDSIKEEFYDLLDGAYGACPEYDVKIILGDFNAKVGKENIFGGLVGKHSLHDTTTDNGFRLIDFAAARNTVISSTRFPRLRIHTATWRSPDGRTANQIDHVLIDARHASNILNVQTFRGANVDSDHFLVAAKFRARLSNEKKLQTAQKKKFNVGSLSTTGVARAYRERLSERLSAVHSPSTNANNLWNQYRDIIKEVAETTIGYQPPPKKSPWYDDECVRRKKVTEYAHMQALQRKTRAAREEYRARRREEKKILRKKKRAYAASQLKEIEESRDRNNTRMFFRKAKQLAAGFKPGTQALRNSEGNLVTEAQGIVDVFKQHFQQLLNGHQVERVIGQEENPHPVNIEPIPPPSLEEVGSAIKKLKNNKAAGSDGLPAELFKHGGDTLVGCMHQIINQVWVDEAMPDDWTISSICPIFKKGDPMSCKNYRGISLLNVAYKILSNVLCERLKPFCNTLIGTYQCGFRPGRSTIDQIFTLRQILEKTNEFQVETHHLFIDFKAAYDSIHRLELYKAMAEFGIPAKLIQLCRVTLENTRCNVQFGNSSSELFRTCTGFRQGDALSCDFFNLVLEQIVRRAGVNTEGTIFNKSVQLLGYADDIDIIGRSQRAVLEAFTAIGEQAKRVGLEVNEDKTKYMLSTNKEASVHRLGQNVTVGNSNFEVVKEFTYLGVNINSTNDTLVEIQRRLTLGNRCYFGLAKQMGSKLLTRKTKCMLYKTLILPVLLYGAECWTISRKAEQILNTFERKILRRIFGPVCEEGEWRRRYNRELYELYQDVDVVQKAKIRRLHWLGHIERMDNNAPAKRVFESQPPGSRRKGRPNLRFKDQAIADARALGLDNWKQRARDRREWKAAVSQAETLHGSGAR